jgi:cell division protein FtsB
MQLLLPLAPYLKRVALPALCLLVSLYFALHALSGSTGIGALRDYQKQRAQLVSVVKTSEEQKRALQRQLELLDPAGIDPDLAEELVRRDLDLVRPDEIIVPLPDTKPAR